MDNTGQIMGEYEQESLSALMDGEADELELRRVLRAAADDPELARRWQRYHLVRSVLQGRGLAVSPGMAAGVAATLATEPPLRQQVAGSSSRLGHRAPWQWRRQLARLAIVASVATVAVVVLQPELPGPDQIPPLAQDGGRERHQSTVEANPAEPIPQTTPATTLVADAPVIAVDPDARQRLREYIEAMRFDPEQPVRIDHLQDSPLYRLVNQYQARP